MHAAIKHKRMADLMLGSSNDRMGLSLRKYEEQKVCGERLPSGPLRSFSGPLSCASLGREGIMLIIVGDGELGEIRVRPD